MVDGVGRSTPARCLPIGGQTGGYTADIAQRAGSQHPALGRARRVGDGRRLDQHRAADRRQPLRRRLQHHLHARRVVRPQHGGATANVPGAAARPSSSRPRRVGGRSAVRSSATGCGSTPWRAIRGSTSCRAAATSGRTCTKGKCGYNYQPDRSQAARRIQEQVAERQRARHVAGDAEEQVQHLLGRAGLLSGPVPRRRVGVHVARVVVVGGRSGRTGCSR